MSEQCDVAVRVRPEVRPGVFRSVLHVLRIWAHRWRSRDELSEMDERMLRDIGLSRMDARTEARQWFWHQ